MRAGVKTKKVLRCYEVHPESGLLEWDKIPLKVRHSLKALFGFVSIGYAAFEKELLYGFIQ